MVRDVARSVIAALAGLTVVAACGSVVGTPDASVAPTSVVLNPPPSGTAPALPPTIAGLTVFTVPAAIGAHQAGPFSDDSLLAVGGWLELTVPLSCPYDPSNPHPALLERMCGWMDHVLADQPQALATIIDNGDGSGSISGRQPTGPYLVPRQGPGGAVNVAVHDHPARAGNGYDPRPAIIVGHFHDPRASLCPSDQRSTCDGEFVADQVAWLDDAALGPTFWFGSYTGVPQKRLQESDVEAAARAAIPAGSTVIWMSGFFGADLPVVDPRPASAVTADATVWYVRYTTPRSSSTPSWGGSGWLVLDDATGSVLARSR